MKNNILWLVVGFIGVAAAASLSYIFGSHWVGYFASITVGVIILILMANSMMETISSSAMKKTMMYLFGFVVILQGFYSLLEWNRVQFQDEVLTEIRRTVDGSIGQVESEKLLIETLRSFYLSDGEQTLEEHFIKVADDRLQENGTISMSEMRDKDVLTLNYEIPDPDSILIHINSRIAKGDDPEFQNRDGQVGRYEAMAILTERGLRYVRQN